MGSGLAPGTFCPLIVNKSFARMRNEGGGFAANIYGAMPESGIEVTSHQSLLIPNPQSLVTPPLKYREKLDTYGSCQNAFFSCKIVVKYYSVVIIGKL